MSIDMNTVLGLLTTQGVLGVFDTLWHHEHECDLPHQPGARKELSLHATRELLYAVIFSSAAWLRWEGVWAFAFIGILASEIVITLADFVEEDRSRRLPPMERVLHTILALSYGATLALWVPELVRSIQLPSGFTLVDFGMWSWLMSLFAVGVFAWGVRDCIAVMRLAVPEWQRHPMRIGSAANPRVVLVTGATGFVGRAVTRALIARGDCVIALSRHPQRASGLLGPSVQVCGSLSEIGAHRQIDAIVNLAGAPLIGWWTSAKRRRLVGSRLLTTEQVVDLIRRLQCKPPVLVNASAIGFYGERSDELLQEDSGESTGFLSELCQQWETAAVRAQSLGVRVCRLRIGLVLGKGGGVLQPLALATRFGGAAVLGTGRQWVSWIHLHDLVRMIEHVIDHKDTEGAVNAVAPAAVAQQQFMQTLALILRRPLLLSIPALVLRSLTGEMSDLFLISQRVVPQRISESGFQFAYPELQDALRDILSEENRPHSTSGRKGEFASRWNSIRANRQPSAISGSPTARIRAPEAAVICEVRESPESRNLPFKVDRAECDHSTCRTARPTSIKTPSRDSERQSSGPDR
jgi:uncharacterized protein (TIGR01777 family)